MFKFYSTSCAITKELNHTEILTSENHTSVTIHIFEKNKAPHAVYWNSLKGQILM